MARIMQVRFLVCLYATWARLPAIAPITRLARSGLGGTHATWYMIHPPLRGFVYDKASMIAISRVSLFAIL